MSDATCETCRFWKSFGKADVLYGNGQCRRHPPTVSFGTLYEHAGDESSKSMGWWYWTTSDDWCGEWEGKGGG